jgi:hypothetical protein
MTRDHAVHLGAGAAVTVAGAAMVLAGVLARDREQLARGATAAALGWLAMRHAAMTARVSRVERVAGAWLTAEPAEPEQLQREDLAAELARVLPLVERPGRG